MRNEELLLSAMDGVKEEYLMEAYEYKRGRASVRKRGILIAVAAAASCRRMSHRRSCTFACFRNSLIWG